MKTIVHYTRVCDWSLFSLIASVARNDWAILTSDILEERLFSSSQKTVIDKRARLGNEKLNKRIFLETNFDILKE
jgi:hypothetical protein